MAAAAQTCFWKHPPAEQARFDCFDGKSRVCARCCVERCRTESPEWFAECAAAGHPTWPASLREAKPPAKLVVLESYWNRRLFNPSSVRGFLDALAPLAQPPLAIAHRYVESGRGLAHYARRPDGVLWTDRRAWDTPVFYLAFHGKPGSVVSVLDTIGEPALCRAFAGYGTENHLVYFAACGTLGGARGRAFARKFLRASGARAVFGYAKDVDWLESMLIDLLFLRRFYAAKNPWRELGAIARSVRRDLAPARRLGWTWVLRDGGD